jgi:hypothetical protein
VDWIAVVVVTAVLAITLAGIFTVTKVGINMTRHPRKASRIRRAKGERFSSVQPIGIRELSIATFHNTR